MNQKSGAVTIVENMLINLLGSQSTITENEDQLSRVTYFNIEKEKSDFVIKLPTNYISDFDGTLEYKDSEQYISLQNYIEFEIYTQLLHQNALPNSFRLSEKLIGEKRNWLPIETSFQEVQFSVLIEKHLIMGLERLEKYLGFKLRKFSSQIINNNKNKISGLIKFYGENGCFRNNGATAESLSYLKAALICQIIDFELQQKETGNPELLKEINSNIVSIVEIVRDIHNKFLNVKMPYFIDDYGQDIVTKKYDPLIANGAIVPFASNKVVFLARKFNNAESDKMKSSIDEEFGKKGFIIRQ